MRACSRSGGRVCWRRAGRAAVHREGRGQPGRTWWGCAAPCAPVACFPRYRCCAWCVRCDAQQEAGLSLKLPEADLSRHAAKHQRRRRARVGGVGDKDDNPLTLCWGLGPRRLAEGGVPSGVCHHRGRCRHRWGYPTHRRDGHRPDCPHPGREVTSLHAAPLVVRGCRC